MTHRVRISRFGVIGAGVVTIAMHMTAGAIEVNGLADFAELFGRYAPGGDCRRQPKILLDASGMSFEVAGVSEKVTNPEFAASYGPHDYEGISKWFFPFRNAAGYPLLMTFNANEQKGTLLIEAQDEGWAGGPPLGPRNKALVSGSPYALCK